jgi:hypothetical protein
MSNQPPGRAADSSHAAPETAAARHHRTHSADESPNLLSIARDHQLSLHHHDLDFYHLLTVFSVSAAMVGVCLTAIGLIKAVENLSDFTTRCDDILLVADAVIFLTAGMCSFRALRLRFTGRWRMYSRAADVAIVLGMTIVVAACAVLASELF